MHSFAELLQGSDSKEAARSPHQGAHWWRCSEYEIIGDSHVAPAADAEIEWFDPLTDWDEYWAGRKRKGIPLPYTELLRRDTSDPEQVIDWVERYGLLGILPHRTIEARFWPRWTAEPLSPQHGSLGMDGRPPDGGAFGTPVPSQRLYTRRAGPWSVEYEEAHREAATVGEPLTDRELKNARESVGPMFPSPIREPGVEVVRAKEGTHEQMGVVRGYAQFFPRRDGVPEWTDSRGNFGYLPWGPIESRDRSTETVEAIEDKLEKGRYPVPGERDFLVEYGEPLHLFDFYASALWETVEYWKEASEANSESDLDKIPHSTGSPPASFHAALRAVHPGTEFQEENDGAGGWVRRWEIPSLYAGLHVMILQDFPLGDAAHKHCEKCDRVFATDNPRQKYCSEQCRKAAEMARLRSDD